MQIGKKEKMINQNLVERLAVRAKQMAADDLTQGDVSRLNTDSCRVKSLIDGYFAEMIVEECCKAYSYDPNIYPNLNVLAIKKHFGLVGDEE